MEWVHCHIARKPLPPSERLKNVPAPVSAIIMKLLAKTAEDRYQTAAGLERDLRRCLANGSAGPHRPLPARANMTSSDRLLIPRTLYGREREIEHLARVLRSRSRRRHAELVLVSGYSGIGKSSLVNELHKELVPPRGLFAAGKFDQYKRDIPYATLAQAFQSLVRSDARQERCGDEPMARRLARSARPEWAAHGQSDPGAGAHHRRAAAGRPSLPPQDQQARFQLVFRRFLGVFARPEHPLALFLDDLQWLDLATLDLIEHLVAHPEVRHLLLIGAYRDNEVGPAHPARANAGAVRRGRREGAGDPARAPHAGGCGAAARRCAAHGPRAGRRPWPN